MKQEVDQIAVEESVIVIIVVRNIHADHDFLKEVSCEFERPEFRIFLFIIDNVLHDVTGIILSVIKTCITQPKICVVIFVRIVKIGFALYIVPSGTFDQKSVQNMCEICRNKWIINSEVL